MSNYFSKLLNMRSPVNNNYQALRGALIEKGTNLKRWAADNNYPFTTVYGAARGTRRGIKSMHIKRQLIRFAYEK